MRFVKFFDKLPSVKAGLIVILLVVGRFVGGVPGEDTTVSGDIPKKDHACRHN